MDRRVKERLIGASILVVLIVLVVPELLSGPKSPPPQQPMLPAAAAAEPNRTVNVDLSTSRSAAASDQEEPPPVQPASAGTPNSTPMPSPSATNPQATSPPANSPPVANPPPHLAPVESTPSPPISSVRAAWSVQLGSFSSRANAENLTRQVKGQGFSAFVLEGRAGSSVRYQVRVGPMPDRESAARMAAKLKSMKHDSSLVSPSG